MAQTTLDEIFQDSLSQEQKPQSLDEIFGTKPVSVSQTIVENIKKLAPSMPQEEALKSPFAKYQGPPQAPKPTDILIQPQADPLWEAQQTVKGLVHGALTSPEAFTQQFPYAEGLGERGKPLIPPVLGEITKRIYETAPVKKVLEPVIPEPGMAGQVGETVGLLGAGAVLSMIPTLARAMRMKPSQVMQQVVAESKATNTPVNEVVKNYLDQYQITGVPSAESQFNVPPKFEGTVTHPTTPVTEPQIPPTIPEPIRAKIKQARMKPPKAGEEVPISAFQAPEVKPAEITPTEPKSFRVTPEEVTPQITQLDDMLAQAQKQRRQLALRDKSTAKLDEFIANLERQKAQVAKPPEVKPTGEITPYREGMEEVKPSVKPKPWEMTQDEFVRQYSGKWKAGVLTDEGKFVIGWDHGDALNKAQDAGYTISGDLGQRAGWRVAGQVVLDKDMPPNEKGLEAGMYQVLRQRFAPTPEAPPVEAKPTEPIPTKPARYYIEGTDYDTFIISDSTGKKIDEFVNQKQALAKYTELQKSLPPTQPEISAGVKEPPPTPTSSPKRTKGRHSQTPHHGREGRSYHRREKGRITRQVRGAYRTPRESRKHQSKEPRYPR